MSKSNVNPNHYKVAGRERQGEDIPQARNKRKHAESLVRRRTKVGEGPPPSAREGGAASPGRARARTAKTAARKARATPLQTPPRSQARAQPGSWTLRAPRAVSEGRAACRARANRCRAKGERQAGNEAAERQTAGRGQARQAVHRTEAGSPSARVRSHAGHERHRPLRKKAVATLAPNPKVTRSGPRWMPICGNVAASSPRRPWRFGSRCRRAHLAQMERSVHEKPGIRPRAELRGGEHAS